MHENNILGQIRESMIDIVTQAGCISCEIQNGTGILKKEDDDSLLLLFPATGGQLGLPSLRYLDFKHLAALTQVAAQAIAQPLMTRKAKGGDLFIKNKKRHVDRENEAFNIIFNNPEFLNEGYFWDKSSRWIGANSNTLSRLVTLTAETGHFEPEALPKPCQLTVQFDNEHNIQKAELIYDGKTIGYYNPISVDWQTGPQP